ncbi:hypothetical protein BT96DRAFT_438726 [Gymnopus androsaceus JB14]|uniref:F-box domain-containing protein n=1 Tax=Gymnopus androsaceus JB14 TaxID=1447944 RepID=A0A6A4I5M6_9AGAR|nr:hypothetical protein BT96DRAFT_438726 [Gymnopus androsaceus JB14]
MYLKMQMLVKQIAPSSWDRLRFYTSRVHTFNQFQLQETETSNVHDSVLARLGEMPPIFPNLRQFYPGSKLSGSNSLIFFLTSTISEAALPFLSIPPPNVRDLGPSLALLASKSPHIRSLMLTANVAYSGFSSSLNCFANLDSLFVSHLSHYEADFIQSVMSLTKLTDLTLRLVSFSCTGIRNSFPSLKRLRLHGSGPDLCNFLRVISPSVLQDLDLRWSEEEDSQTIEAVFNAVVCFSSTLRVLSIDHITPILLPWDDDAVFWLLFKSLFQLTQLRNLSYGISMSLTKKQTAEVASAWPHIEILRLNAFLWKGDIPPVQSLAYFAQRCPNLITLDYPVDLAVPFDSKALPPRAISTHPLRSFHCTLDDDVTNPVAIALRLYLIFPALKFVDGRGDRWDEVQAILDTYHLLNGMRS